MPRPALLLGLGLLCALAPAPGVQGLARPARTRLHAIKNEGSYYKRPAKAFEKGGGFFIPGLKEPYKLKAVVATLVTGALIVNRGSGYVPPDSQVRSEAIAVACAAVLVAQAAYEAVQDLNAGAGAGAGDDVIVAGWAPGAAEEESELRSLVPWAARALQVAAEDVCAVLYVDGAALRHVAGTYPSGSDAVRILDGAAPAPAALGLPAELKGSDEGVAVAPLALTPELKALLPPSARAAILARSGTRAWVVASSGADAPAAESVAAVLRGVFMP